MRAAVVAGCRLGERPDGCRYVVHTEDVETFGRLVRCGAHRQGLETAQRVVVVGDGAGWIWRLAGWRFGRAVQVLDLWHAAEHLWAAGRVLYEEGDDRAPAWVGRAKERLLGGEVSELLAEWGRKRAQRGGEPAAPESWRQELGYFHNRAQEIRYGEYPRRGLPIGSGAVESANGHVVGV